MHNDPLCMYCYAESTPNPNIDEDCKVYPATQGELNKERCHDPSCPCPYIGFGCTGHHNAKTKGVDAEYCKKHGVLTLMCRGCGGVVLIVAVAREYELVPASAGPFLLSPKGIWEGPEKNQVKQ